MIGLAQVRHMFACPLLSPELNSFDSCSLFPELQFWIYLQGTMVISPCCQQHLTARGFSCREGASWSGEDDANFPDQWGVPFAVVVPVMFVVLCLCFKRGQARENKKREVILSLLPCPLSLFSST
jgi:hypothetical protein